MKTISKILSIALCLAMVLGLFTFGVAAANDTTWEKIDLADIKATDIIAITMTHTTNGTYALYSGNGTSKAPTAVAVTVSDDGQTMTAYGADATTIGWNISNNEGVLTIYPNGSTDTWLYTTDANNGVRVGTNEDYGTWVVDDNYLKCNTTVFTRWMGVYNKQDWRAYKNTTNNTKDQTLSFWKYVGVAADCQHENTDVAYDGVNHWTYCVDCNEIRETAIPHEYDAAGVCTCGRKLPTAIADGDRVLMYNASSGKILSANANGGKLYGVNGTVTDGKLSASEGAAVLEVQVDASGYYTFLAGGKYLTSGETGNSLTFEDAASDYSLWTLDPAPDGYYIRNVNAAYSGNKNQCIEYFSGAFTTYGLQVGQSPSYTFEFFKVASLSTDMSMTLDNTLYVHFQIEGAADYTGYSAQLTVGEADPIACTIDSNGLITAPLMVSQLDESFTVALYEGELLIDTKTDKANDYLNRMIANANSTQRLKNICSALLAYGEYTEKGLVDDATGSITLSGELNAALASSDDNVSADKNQMRLNLTNAVDIEIKLNAKWLQTGYTYSINGGDKVDLTQESDLLVTITGIPVTNWGEIQTVVVYNAEGEAVNTIGYAVMSYAYDRLEGKYADEPEAAVGLNNLLTAMANYYLAVTNAIAE